MGSKGSVLGGGRHWSSPTRAQNYIPLGRSREILAKNSWFNFFRTGEYTSDFRIVDEAVAGLVAAAHLCWGVGCPGASSACLGVYCVSHAVQRWANCTGLWRVRLSCVLSVSLMGAGVIRKG